MTAVGIGITALTVFMLVTEFLHRQRGALPAYGWIAGISLLAAEWFVFRGTVPISIYFTPMAWTCYILLTDAAVWAVNGRSRLHDDPKRLALTALLSIPLWLLFEAYNLRLQNWVYVGVPRQWFWGLLGYGWSFATITPGIFETADLIEAFGWFQPAPPIKFSSVTQSAMIFFGAACLLLPLVVAQPIARYLFVLVWLGFIFLLDPINHRLGLPSLLSELAAGRREHFYSLLIAGWMCGWLWEFWNFWAAAKWHYIFPMFQTWKIFEMPAPGYLGFLPFALECWVMYVTAAGALGIIKTAKPSCAEPSTEAEHQRHL
jgi:hypothetical protein